MGECATDTLLPEPLAPHSNPTGIQHSHNGHRPADSGPPARFSPSLPLLPSLTHSVSSITFKI